MYRTLAIREEEAPRNGRVDRIVVPRLGFWRRAFAALAAFVLGRPSLGSAVVIVDADAKTVTCGAAKIAFVHIVHPWLDWAKKQLVLVLKGGDHVVLCSGVTDAIDDARNKIAHALIAEYASIRDMPPVLAALARQLCVARSYVERQADLLRALRALPLDDLRVTEEALAITARGQRDGHDVVVRYVRRKDRFEVVVPRRAKTEGHIDFLRGDFGRGQSGLVELTHRIFANGSANSVAFGRLAVSARVLTEMDRLNLRHVYLFPAEVKIIPYDTFLELRDPDLRVGDFIALAVACA